MVVVDGEIVERLFEQGTKVHGPGSIIIFDNSAHSDFETTKPSSVATLSLIDFEKHSVKLSS